MFGYVLPFKPELKMREWQEYRSVYCGLCKELKREYGFASRLFLNYDLVLLALFCDSLADEETACSAQRCIANPVQKRPVCHSTPGLALAADALVLSVYYKLMDNRADERFWKRLPLLALWPIAARYRKKAAQKQPQLDALLAQQTKAQAKLEAEKTCSADAAAEPTAQMTAGLFAVASTDPCSQKALYRLGLFIGKIIYYLDAAEDFEKDAKQGAYNVFVLQGKTKQEAVDEAQRLCRMCTGEASLCYNLLSLHTHKGVLDNILFLGLPQSIALAGQPRQKPNHK